MAFTVQQHRLIYKLLYCGDCSFVKSPCKEQVSLYTYVVCTLKLTVQIWRSPHILVIILGTIINSLVELMSFRYLEINNI